MAVEGSMDQNPIPFRILTQEISSTSVFLPTNGMSDHSGMHTPDILRNNIRHLLRERSLTEAEAADRAGINQSWLNRFMRQDIKKANPEKIALLARVFEVSASDLSYSDLAQLEDQPASQPVGSERAIVAAAVKLVRELEAMSLEPLPQETYADRLFVAMKVIREEGAGGILDEAGMVPVLRRFAAELRKAG